MDSLTHLFVGGAIGAAIAPAHRRRLAMLLGAALNSVPDIDVPIAKLLALNPVDDMTWHRGPSHSLFVLIVAGLLIAAACRRWWPLWQEAPRRWFWMIMACLLAHPLADALTTYGTQLFWPVPTPPVMISSLFIIDPLFSLPLIVGCVAAWCYRLRHAAQVALMVGLCLSMVYSGWSLVAKSMIEQSAASALVELGLADAPRFSVPTPFNTLLWRVVVMTPGGYLEGERSLIADNGPMRFRTWPSDQQALRAVTAFAAVQRLVWFNHGFMSAQELDGDLVLSDLRMGSEPDYAYRFVVATRGDSGAWVEIPPRALDWPWESSERLRGLWTRIWHQPVDPASNTR